MFGRTAYKCAPCHVDIRRGEQALSKLVGANHVLCKDCAEHEDVQIGKKGTKDIPSLLNVYGPANWEGES